MTGTSIQEQILNLKYHLSQEIQEKKDAIERVKDIRMEIKELEKRFASEQQGESK